MLRNFGKNMKLEMFPKYIDLKEKSPFCSFSKQCLIHIRLVLYTLTHYRCDNYSNLKTFKDTNVDKGHVVEIMLYKICHNNGIGM